MTEYRSQFVKLAVLTVVVALGVGGILTPLDPSSQFRIVGMLIGAGFVGSYWLVYKSTVDLPTLRWDDLFRWYVSTLLFGFLVVLLIDPDSVSDNRLSQILQLGILLISAGLAWVVVHSERIPWPGDR
ncbi:MAG: hypothetical protein U9O06_14365 [Euryarchaeota archaeon]|nr:hypothetical protein [Euryarchaeota archaeon]